MWVKKSSIGGQAVIEGVMMRGPQSIATAIRKSDGEIIVDVKPYKSLSQKHRLLKLPIMRGVIAFFESLVVGMKTLMFSAEHFDLEEDQEDYKPSRFEAFLNKLLGDKFQDAVILFSLMLAIVFGVGLFILIPNLIAKLTFSQDRIMYNLVEGVARLIIFLVYIILVSRLKDIQRVFQYHGAEHKTIHCYEHEEPLTVENVCRYPTLHPRCGTSFLLIVMVVSIVVFSFFWSENFIITLSTRLALLPLVAGLSYELLKIAGRSENRIAQAFNAPGMWFQRFTTREPGQEQIEVAIKALEGVMVEDREADKW